MGKLTALQIKNAKPGRYADGNGLYLLVSPTGSKSWVLRVQVDKRRRDYGLGSLDVISLAKARERALERRGWAKDGLNPSQEAKRLRACKKTFEEVARAYHEEHEPHWKNAKHGQQWINTLETYVFPTLGNLSVDRIDAAEIQSVLLPIWTTKPETARRVKQRIATTLDNAKAKGWRQSEAPMRAVSTLLKGIKQPKAKNFAAMPYRALPAFMGKLDTPNPSVGRLALRFLVLTAARSGEVRGATWSEIDEISSTWTIPGDRMKMGVEHVVPLTAEALAILTEAKRHSSYKSDSLIFPGLRRKPLSDMTLSKVLKSNGGADYTVHGFRSAFKDWSADHGYPNEVSEAALAHAVANKVEAAYRRTTFYEQRSALMDAWGDFCRSSPETNRTETS